MMISATHMPFHGSAVGMIIPSFFVENQTVEVVKGNH
jgi:hypothetical protein